MVQIDTVYHLQKFNASSFDTAMHIVNGIVQVSLCACWVTISANNHVDRYSTVWCTADPPTLSVDRNAAITKLYRTITSDEPKGFFVFTRVTVPVHYEQQIRTMSENSHTFSSVVIEIEGERHNKRADKIYSINAESLHQSIMM